MIKEAKILVVDDNQFNSELLGAVLELEGYHIFYAKNGNDALDMVEETQPHVILLDIMMPGMDGFEVTRRLRANPKTEAIPILLLTALDALSDKVRGLEGFRHEIIGTLIKATNFI